MKERNVFPVALQRSATAYEAVRKIESEINELCAGGWVIVGARFCNSALELKATREVSDPRLDETVVTEAADMAPPAGTLQPIGSALSYALDPVGAEEEAARRNEQLAREARESGTNLC